jgi:hypothetical protein
VVARAYVPSGSQLVADRSLEAGDCFFVALVERPLLDAIGVDEARRHKDAHMLAQCRLTDAEFLGDQQATHAIFHKVAVDLRTEMPRRLLEPVEDLKAAVVVERAKLFDEELAWLRIRTRPYSRQVLSVLRWWFTR